MPTSWDSLESIKAFACSDEEKARYYKSDAEYLLELELTARHCEVAES
jgi:hypothetical protein